MASCTLKGLDYTATIYDNAPSSNPDVQEGHNGIRSWERDDDPDTQFIAHSWLNLEHVITDDRQFFGNRKDPGFFEPRQFPIELAETETGVRISHQPLARTGCACWIEYAPGDRPGCLDFRLGFTPTQKVSPGGTIGLFLPCYIYQPEHKSIHFIGRSHPDSRKRWVEYCASCHRSVVNFAADQTPHPPAFETDNLHTYMDIARFSYPFFCGRINNLTFALMIDPGDDLELRFWMSPEGGGWNTQTHLTNPAWDFVLLKFGYEINREYTARGRLLLAPLENRWDVIEEYQTWSGKVCSWED